MQGDNLRILLLILLSSIAVESLITLIKDSDISLWIIHPIITNRYQENQTWYNLTLYKWITCGHCMSFVYSFPFSLIISWYVTGLWTLLLIWLTIQRLSNWFNVLYKLLAHGRVSAIEFVSPLIGVNPQMSSGNYFEDIQARQFNKGTLQKVFINSLHDIQRIIKTTSTENNKVKNATVIIDGKPTIINTATNHPSYMQMIKDLFLEEHIQNKSESEPVLINGEILIPVQIRSSTSVEKMIEQFTGGTRDGYRIKWQLNDGTTYFYDPISEKLTKLND